MLNPDEIWGPVSFATGGLPADGAQTLAAEPSELIPATDLGRPWRPAVSSIVLGRVVQSIDIAILLGAGLAAAGIVAPGGTLTLECLVALALLSAIAATAVLNLAGAYRATVRDLAAGNFMIAVALPSVALSAAVVSGLLERPAPVPLVLWAASWLGCTAGLFAIARLVLVRLVRLWRQRGQLDTRVALVGAVNAAPCDRIEGIDWVGTYGDEAAGGSPVRRRGSLDRLLADSRTERIDVIVMALPADEIAAASRRLRSTLADVYAVCDEHDPRRVTRGPPAVLRLSLRRIAGRPLGSGQRFSKGAFDHVVGALLLLGVAPVMLLIALAIRLDSPGPVLFRQPRIGYGGRLFICLKFRTMRADACDLLADRQATRGDRRVTRVGRWLRRISFDELPQLFNVVRGDMSLVGPRPHAPNTKVGERRFADLIDGYDLRHCVKPGITGWAQVNGWRGETRTPEQLRNRVACDLHYIDHWSFGLDLRILVLTLVCEIFSDRAF